MRHAPAVPLSASPLRRRASAAGTAIQAAWRGRVVRMARHMRYFTIEPLRTCGHDAMWKVGIGDLLKQITILHSVGAAAGLQYVHTPLRSSQTLSRPHRGSCSVDDIDFEAFLGVGANEQPVSTLPPLPTTVVHFNYRSTDDGGLEGAADRLLRTPGPCLLVLVFSYELLNSALALASLARHLGVPPRILRSPRCGLRLAYKYANARRSDRFSCGWRAGAIRVAVHVRRGDRAWVEVGGEGIGGGGSGGEEVDAGGTLYCMHQGLWTCRNLGRTCKLDGTLCLSDSASQGAIEGIRSRAPPAALLARCAELVRVALLSASGGGPTAARGAAATEVDILIVSDGYGEEYYRGFGDRVEAAFAAKQAADWARLRAMPSSRLVVGNDEPATRLAVDALLSAHVVVVGGGSHLPDVCQRYLTKPIKPNKGRAAWVNAWELRDEIGRGMLPEVVVCDLRAAAARAAAQVESGTGGTGDESHSEEEEEEDDKVGGSERHCSEVTVDAIGRSLEVCRLSAAPRLAVVSNLLTPSECAHIIRLGVESGGLHPSRVVRHAMPCNAVAIAGAVASSRNHRRPEQQRWRRVWSGEEGRTGRERRRRRRQRIGISDGWAHLIILLHRVGHRRGCSSRHSAGRISRRADTGARRGRAAGALHAGRRVPTALRLLLSEGRACLPHWYARPRQPSCLGAGLSIQLRCGWPYLLPPTRPPVSA